MTYNKPLLVLLILFVPFSAFSQVFKLLKPKSGKDEMVQKLYLAPAKLNGKWGYIDTLGNWVIEPEFGQAKNFHEGFAEVIIFKDDSIKTGFIKPAMGHQLAIELVEYNFSQFSEGMLPYTENGVYGFIDSTGKKSIPAQFKYVSNFYEGKALVYFKSGKAGYINKSKQLLISPRYDTAFNFNGKFAVVGKKYASGNIQYGCIDQYGNIIIPYKYDWMTNFSEGKAFANSGGVYENRLLTGGKWFIIDLEQEAVTPLNNDTSLVVEVDNSESDPMIMCFRSGVSWFPSKVNNMVKLGMINPEGKWIVNPIYFIVGRISENRAGAFKFNKMGFIDLKGNVVVPFSFQSVGAFHSGFAWFKEGNHYGFISKNGEVRIPPKFEDTGDFMLVEIKK